MVCLSSNGEDSSAWKGLEGTAGGSKVSCDEGRKERDSVLLYLFLHKISPLHNPFSLVSDLPMPELDNHT